MTIAIKVKLLSLLSLSVLISKKKLKRGRPVPYVSEEILVQNIEAALIVLPAVVHPRPGGLNT